MGLARPCQPWTGALLAAQVLGAASLGAQDAPSQRPTTTVSLTTTRVRQCCTDSDTWFSVLALAREVSPRWGLYARLGLVRDTTQDTGSTAVLTNPALGATYDRELGGGLSLAALGGLALPLGGGGGDRADLRPLYGMLNATDWGGPMFTPNHVDLFLGARLERSLRAVTLRAGSTLNFARRVRGARVDPVGHTVIYTASDVTLELELRPEASVFAQLARTYYHNNPLFVGGERALRDDVYLIGGAAFSLPVGTRSLRPTALYARALDAPKAPRRYDVIELDLALEF